MGKIIYPELQNKEWLLDQYIVQKKSMKRIASELGTSASVVLDALRRKEVKIRTIGEAGKGRKFSEDHKSKISKAHKGKSKSWMLGKGNANWQGGRTGVVQMGRTTVKYNVWKETVMNRDIFCVNCGSTKNRVAHHIKFYQEYPELKFDISNGVVLCRSCHSTYHISLPRKKGLIRRTTQVVNAEPAEAIA